MWAGAARHRWLRSAASPAVVALLLVALLSAAGFVVAMLLVSADRRAAARQQATSDAGQVQALLARADTFVASVGNALHAEPAPGSTVFESLVAGQSSLFLLGDAMWVESVPTGGGVRYEATFVT
jgi:type II secretory pathway pseudopilin PulG